MKGSLGNRLSNQQTRFVVATQVVFRSRESKDVITSIARLLEGMLNKEVTSLDYLPSLDT